MANLPSFLWGWGFACSLALPLCSQCPACQRLEE